MTKAQFSHVTTWVFDLDNTLYCPSVRLFDQIEKRMTQFVMDTLHIPHAEADAQRVAYWREHGTTLAGLMAEHALDPGPFLHAVHDISFDALSPDPALRARLGPPGPPYRLYQRHRPLCRTGDRGARPVGAFRCGLWCRACELYPQTPP